MTLDSPNARAYNLANSEDWQALLTHFELGEGFALIVLLVPNEAGGDVTRRALLRYLTERDQTLLVIDTSTPERLSRVATKLLPTDAAPPDVGAVWVERVVSEGDPGHLAWRKAWRHGLASLNQHRNPFRRAWNVPVIFVGDGGLQEIMREHAPDVWSVRTLVSVVEPESALSQGRLEPEHSTAPVQSGPDPEMALREAATLRGKPGSEAAIARLLYRAALGFKARYRWPEAANCLTESLAIRESIGASATDLADTHYQLANVAFWRFQYAVAGHHHEIAQSQYTRESHRLGEANCMRGLGDIALRRSDHLEARRLYQEALTIYGEINDGFGQANCLKSIGDIVLQRSDPAEARRLYQEGLSIFREIGDHLGEANSLQRLGDVALRRADHAEARRRYQEAAAIYSQIGERLGEANSIQGLGDIALRRGDIAEARRRYHETIPIFREIGQHLGGANSLKSIGDIAFARGDHAEARHRYQEALTTFREIGDHLGEANSLKSIGDIALSHSDHAEGLRLYQEALAIYREIGERLGEANCIRGLGDIARAEGDTNLARANFKEALAVYQSLPEPYSIGNSLLRLAHIESDPAKRHELLASATNAWRSIEREDLIDQLRGQFPGEI